ncbi:hypothetical protein [Kitasatospora purpeofusca]|uniref:DUF3396 domain-containing protein n=1 Tax=Kitasatospora purpeofusca TaxID=67352 RepID=A0ABZ1U2A5_9ACTN|nr:hypothetical protein [Kitasatospora purpeofusca]
MLRREGDGVTWWIRREQLEGRTGEPHRSLVLTLATRGGADEQARLGSLLLELLEDGFQEAGASAVFRGAAVTRHDFSREPFGERGLMEGLLGVLATGEVFQSNWLWTVTGTGVAEEAKPGPIGLDLYGGQFGSDIWQWQIDVGTESGSDAFLDHLAVLWADSLRVVGERTDLLWGGIYHDVYAMSEPPYERYHGILQGLQTADRHPRGYYWCNHLSAGQLDRLGGIDAVATRAAGAGLAAEPVLRAGAPAGLLVTVREPVTALSDEALAAVRDLVAPALHPEPYHWYGGPPLRVLKEPGTAFRPIPADIIEPWFEDDPPIEPDGGIARRLVPDED